MTEYAAGTVAEVTWDDASLAAQNRGESNVKTQRAIYTDDGYWSLTTERLSCIQGAAVTDVRPLIVLDLDGLVEPQTLANFMRATGLCGSRTIGDALADQIEAQTKPPRIPEPGLYGVVEATVDGADRRRFCHLEDDGEGWSGAGAWFYWRDLTDPKLIRPGIEDES